MSSTPTLLNVNGIEPPREFRRLIVVSHAAMAYSGLSR